MGLIKNNKFTCRNQIHVFKENPSDNTAAVIELFLKPHSWVIKEQLSINFILHF